jgi:hypothetical protein
MTTAAWLWVVFTLVAATAQTFRNATQKSLIGQLGTVGATHVRFLFWSSLRLVNMHLTYREWFAISRKALQANTFLALGVARKSQ